MSKKHNIAQDIFDMACEINRQNAANLAAPESDPAYVESFSHWLFANQDTLPEPESFHEWLERNRDAIPTNLSGGPGRNIGKTPSSSEDSAQTNADASVDELTTPAQFISPEH